MVANTAAITLAIARMAKMPININSVVCVRSEKCTVGQQAGTSKVQLYTGYSHHQVRTLGLY